MEIKNAKFLISAPSLSQCPQSSLPEIALIGRSNVGKSSFLNKISNNMKLAKTSNTPGKTRLINLFSIDNRLIFADLPGYGYAKVSKQEQAKWQKNFEEYLLRRENLVGVFHFIDARHDIQENDFQMHDYLNIHNIFTVNILSKCDYLSRNEVSNKIREVKKNLNNDVIPFSTKTNYYMKQFLDILDLPNFTVLNHTP